MHKDDLEEKIRIVKDLLKEITKGAKPEKLKEKYREFFSKTSPIEIAFIEQQLVAEGIKPEKILRVCDLHVELFREYLASQTIKDLPKGHPLDLLIRENTEIMKLVEVLTLYANTVLSTTSQEEKKTRLDNTYTVLNKIKQYIRLHYRKNQMVIFPYLEKRGINAVPRVLWGREDQVIKRIRELLANKEKFKPDEVAKMMIELGREINDLVFRENKILYPAVKVLFKEGEWVAIHEMNSMLGYLVSSEEEWKPSADPVYPYQVDPKITEKELEKLPKELVSTLKDIKPDNYKVIREEDIDLDNGFVSRNDLIGIFESLPLEITFADKNDRVRFFTKSKITGGFPRLRTIIGRKLEYCHPPRLENYVKMNVELLKKGKHIYREFWTRMGDRIIRVLIVGVKDKENNYIGTLEVVEDFTEILNNPEEIKNKIIIL